MRKVPMRLTALTVMLAAAASGAIAAEVKITIWKVG